MGRIYNGGNNYGEDTDTLDTIYLNKTEGALTYLSKADASSTYATKSELTTVENEIPDVSGFLTEAEAEETYMPLDVTEIEIGDNVSINSEGINAPYVGTHMGNNYITLYPKSGYGLMVGYSPAGSHVPIKAINISEDDIDKVGDWGYHVSDPQEFSESLNETIAWLRVNGGSGILPAVTSSDDGKALTVVDGEWDKSYPAGFHTGYIHCQYDDQDITNNTGWGTGSYTGETSLRTVLGNLDDAIGTKGLPEVTSSDNGSIMKVENGDWALSTQSTDDSLIIANNDMAPENGYWGSGRSLQGSLSTYLTTIKQIGDLTSNMSYSQSGYYILGDLEVHDDDIVLESGTWGDSGDSSLVETLSDMQGLMDGSVSVADSDVALDSGYWVETIETGSLKGTMESIVENLCYNIHDVEDTSSVETDDVFTTGNDWGYYEGESNPASLKSTIHDILARLDALEGN